MDLRHYRHDFVSSKYKFQKNYSSDTMNSSSNDVVLVDDELEDQGSNNITLDDSDNDTN